MTLPWYPRDMGKYARDTKHLTMLEHGAYNLLLDYYYSTGGLPRAMQEQCRSNALPMPDHSRIYRVGNAMTKVEQEAVDAVLSFFFVLSDDGFYRHSKCDEVIEIQTEKHEKRVNAAKKKSVSNARAMQEQCSSNAPQKENQIKTKNKIKSDGDFSDEIDEDDFIREHFDIEMVLSDKAIEAAREAAPGWDVYVLMRDFNTGIKMRKMEIPKNPDKAFPAWCKSIKKGKRP